MKQPELKPEDGADFIGRIEILEGGIVQASCQAYDSDRIEEQAFRTCGTVAEAEEWIAHEAGRRGFIEYRVTMPPASAPGGTA